LTKDYKQKAEDHNAISLTRKSDLEQYILEGRSLAKKMFGFDTPLKVDEENKTEAGHYDFRSDTAYVHPKFFQNMNKKYANIDLKKLVEHTVCHEIGHAFDARQFALRGIFPYVVKISDRSIATIASYPLKTNKFKEAIIYLINSILDYSIDKKIWEESRFCDQTAKIRMRKIRTYLHNSAGNEGEGLRRAVELFFDLPTFVHDYQFGDIDPPDRNAIKRCCIAYLGEKAWNTNPNLLKELRIGDARKFYDIIPLLFRGLLDLTAFWKPEKRENICENLPSFWNQTTYELLLLN